MTGDARFDRFVGGAALPTRKDVVGNLRIGSSAQALSEALFDGDLDAAQRYLARDPALASFRIGDTYDMLCVALATASTDALDLLIAHGARVEGPALALAMMADDPAFAMRLLQSGAKATPADSPLGPMRAAIAANSVGAVRLLLDFGADLRAAGPTGTRALQVALDMERFRIAELLLDRGADPWAIDASGANLGTSVTTAMFTAVSEEEASQARLAQRALALGWPNPALTPGQIREAALSGNWPPPGIKAAPMPADILALLVARAKGTATIQ
ncbi:ankyrin repeat domain-containing protein [Sphingomonas sp. UYAg733]